MNKRTSYRLLYFRDNNFIRKNTISMFYKYLINIFSQKSSILTIMSDKNSKNVKLDKFNIHLLINLMI
jgi:hypothetical protein